MMVHHFPVSLIDEEEEKECYKSNVYVARPAPSLYAILFGLVATVIVVIILGIYELFRYYYYGPRQQLPKPLTKQLQLITTSPSLSAVSSNPPNPI